VALQEGNPQIPALTRHFNDKMKIENVPLFATEEAFRCSLAGRRCSWAGVDKTEDTTEAGDVETIEFTAEPGAKYLPLCEQPFWANDEDVDQMVEQLKRSGSVERGLVKYLAARSNSGKTSSVFAAFLRGLEEGKFTHLLYIAFDNNEQRSFRVTPSNPFTEQDREDRDLLELQGAAFILEVVKRLLMEPDSNNQKYSIERATREDLADKSYDSLAKELQVFLCEKLGNCKLLIHADEYPKMCSEHDGADSFHRGAMTLLSLTDQALDSSTVATHVKLLKAIPQLGSVSTGDTGSAGVCRLPVACPRLDIDKVMRDVPELCFPSGQWDVAPRTKPQRRLLASLRFRLGLKLTALGPQWLHLRGKNQDMEVFLAAFNRSAQPAKDRPRNNRGVVRALVVCSALCKTSAQVERAAPGAAELLMGREDIDFSGADDGFFQAGNFQAVVLDNGRVSASLESLLASFDPDCPVYNRGQSLFTDVLRRNDQAVPNLAENADGDVCLLSGSPLEASFVWALSTRASIFGRLIFGEKKFEFECNKLYPGGGGWTEGMRRPPSRLFPGKDSSDYDLSSVMDDANANAFFHAEEGAGLETHPLADAWFRAKINNVDSLVLLDFAGGGFESVSNKDENARSWIAAEREKVGTEYNLDLHVVILAPFAPGYRQQGGEPNDNVEVVLGEDARLLLGGLGQVSRWFV
jgi:hypothetical protein